MWLRRIGRRVQVLYCECPEPIDRQTNRWMLTLVVLLSGRINLSWDLERYPAIDQLREGRSVVVSEEYAGQVETQYAAFYTGSFSIEHFWSLISEKQSCSGVSFCPPWPKMKQG